MIEFVFYEKVKNCSIAKTYSTIGLFFIFIHLEKNVFGPTKILFV